MSPALRKDLSVAPYSFTSFCFKHFDGLFLCGYILRIVMSSWRIDFFIVIQYPFSPLTFCLVPKSVSPKLFIAPLIFF